MAQITFAVGGSIHDNAPKVRQVADFGAFVNALDKNRAKSKPEAKYICAPVNGDGRRCAEGVLPVRYLAFDLDRIDADVLPEVRMWFARFSGCGWATHSSKPDAPRERVILELDREVNRDECMGVGACLAGDLRSEFGDRIQIDQATFRPEQPVFVPPVGVTLARFDGAPVKVDECLRRKPPPAAPDRAQGRSDDEDVLRALETGEGLHEAILRLVARMAGKGLDRDTIKTAALGLLERARRVRGGRVDAIAGAELDRMIAGALKKYAKPPGRPAAVATDAAMVGGVAVTLTEDNIARVFAEQYGSRLLFDHTSGRWLQWDGARWKPEDTRLAYHYTRELTRGLNAEGKARWAKAAVYGAVETIARTDRVFARTLDQFDLDPWVIGTPAGIVNLKTGKIMPPDPEAMITKNTIVAPAVGEPERWLRFLDEATGADAEVVKFLKRLCGYCLTGITNEHILVFIYGPGGNGKGVFINVVSRVLGDYAQSADMRVFTASRHDRHPTELAALRGARLVTASETEQTAEWAESRVKQLTGGDTVRARFMRCDEFEFKPAFKLVIIGNHRPRLRDVGDAMRRRLRMVPFDHTPAVVNPNLEDQLVQQEGGQILNWMIEGCLDWQEDGLTTPEAVRVATADYFDSQDTLGEWIATFCDLDRRYSERSASLFRSWVEFCKAAGDDPGSQVQFADALKRRGLRKEHTMIGKVWYGIRLKPAESEGP